MAGDFFVSLILHEFVIDLLTQTFQKSNPLNSVCPKTRCLDGKIQFRGVLKKMMVRFTGVNERLFFLTQRRKWSFRPNTK